MLSALDEHLGFRYTDIICETIGSSYLELAITARRNNDRAEMAKHLFSCLRNGGWHLRGARRTLAGLAAYLFIGNWYRVFSKAKRAHSR